MTDRTDGDDIDPNSSEDTNMSPQAADAEWAVDHEHILVEWADKSMCMRLCMLRLLPHIHVGICGTHFQLL